MGAAHNTGAASRYAATFSSTAYRSSDLVATDARQAPGRYLRRNQPDSQVGRGGRRVVESDVRQQMDKIRSAYLVSECVVHVVLVGPPRSRHAACKRYKARRMTARQALGEAVYAS